MGDDSETFYWHDALPFGLLPLLSLSCYALPIIVVEFGGGWLDFLIRGPAMLYHIVIQALALIGIVLSWLWFFQRWGQIPRSVQWSTRMLVMSTILLGSTALIVVNAYLHLFVMANAPFAGS